MYNMFVNQRTANYTFNAIDSVLYQSAVSYNHARTLC